MENITEEHVELIMSVVQESTPFNFLNAENLYF